MARSPAKGGRAMVIKDPSWFNEIGTQTVIVGEKND